ncbi:MAG: 3,4-dihydroxy-2-butanone-4-phosphate synthase [Proteobacteria bacterium]|nr:3,4-dihydroxy-2-butanone-4-phosphate synthase [Pseudomonadota bacterium]
MEIIITIMISKIEEIIEEAKNGRPFILMDDEHRENEGDIVIPAEFATPEAINFMITHARGLVCLALQKKRIEELGLTLMTKTNGSRFETAFTTSIEAKEGVTTGISVFDRSHTIKTAIFGTKEDIVTPGHIFPLIAKDGGVLIRAGHTEASVDISILAGLNPSSVICEIINHDGTMARMDNITAFAKAHNLKIGLIKDLIEYRSKKESIVIKTEEKPFAYVKNSSIITYCDTINGATHYAITFGKIDATKPVNVKFHVIDYIADIFFENGFLQSVELLKKEGGILVLINNKHATTVQNGIIREYGIGISIIKNLGVKKITIFSKHNPNPVAIEGFGVEIVGFKSVG